jgi:tRNA U34 5-carboxymethylaminomethyl modifying enzyme MnmG/GidA
MMERLMLGLSILLYGLLNVVTAEFTVSFKNVVRGDPFELKWEAVDKKYYPLYIQCRAFNHTGTYEVNAFQSSITGEPAVDSHAMRSRSVESSNRDLAGLLGNSFTWTNVPYPIRFLGDSAEYELEVRSHNIGTQGGVSVLARSTLFQVQEAGKRTYNGPPKVPILCC